MYNLQQKQICTYINQENIFDKFDRQNKDTSQNNDNDLKVITEVKLQSQQEISKVKKNSRLKVININYSGLYSSPFQFYQSQYGKNTEDLAKLSQIFQDLILLQRNQHSSAHYSDQQNFVDKKDKSFMRYNPIYNNNVGIQLDNMNIGIRQNSKKQKELQNYSQFQQSWRKHQDSYNENIQKNQNNTKKLKIRQQMIKFDLICYKSIIQHVYRNQFNLRRIQLKNQGSSFESINNLQFSQSNFIKTLPYQKYQNYLIQMFSKSWINQQSKLKKTVQILIKIDSDIVFLLNATKKARQSLKTQLKDVYQCFYDDKTSSASSIILLRRSIFLTELKAKSQFIGQNSVQFLDTINSNKQILAVKNNQMILIAVNQCNDRKQTVQQRNKLIKYLQKIHTEHQDCIIIVGGKFDTIIQQRQVNTQYCYFPSNNRMCTAITKRNSLSQSRQTNKQPIKSCSFQIISNRNLINKNIWNTQCQMPDQRIYLPNNDHPYEDYILYTEIGNTI